LPLPPLLYAIADCSESSTIQEVARAMLLAHGIDTASEQLG